ncbi:unnamed protein product [Cylicocyclus nassatus]|uniref:Uncharacterized protein n=1 Tax=Cylicocyclus nassatus TaxID=53992 RepID=A0AA36HBU8_CYLNA|nr:unnamed protein product [Cylicocyclus nassatus]
MPKRVRHKKIIDTASETGTTQEPELYELENGWIVEAVAARKEGRVGSADSETDTTQEPEPFELEQMTTQEPEPFELELLKSSTPSLTEERITQIYPDGNPTVQSENNPEAYRTSVAPTMHSTEVSESENKASKRGYDKEKTNAASKFSLMAEQAITEQAIFYNVPDRSSAGYTESSQVKSSDFEKMRKTLKIKRLKDLAHRYITPTKALIKKTWELETHTTKSKTVQTKNVKVARITTTASTKEFLLKTMSSKERQRRKKQTKIFLPHFTTHSKARTKKANETRILISALISGKAKRRPLSRTNIARQISAFRVTDDKSLQRKQARKKEEIGERAFSTSIEPAKSIGRETPEMVLSRKMIILASNTEGPLQNSISRLMRSKEVLSSNESQGNIAFVNIFLLPNLLETTNISEPVSAKLNTVLPAEPTAVVTTETLPQEIDEERVAPTDDDDDVDDVDDDDDDDDDATQDSKDTVKATLQSLPERTEDGRVSHMDAERMTTIVVTEEPSKATEKSDIVASTKADAPTGSVHKSHGFTEDVLRSVEEALKIADTIEATEQSELVESSTTLVITTTVHEGAATTIANEEKVIGHGSGTSEPIDVESSSSLATEEMPTLSRHKTLSEGDEAALAASTENNIDSPSTTIASGNTEETAFTEQNISLSEVIANESSRVWPFETDYIESNSSAEEALAPEKQQRTEPPSTLNVHLHHYNNVISVELLLVTALILVCALFALLFVVFLAIRNERKFQRKKAGYLSEALHEVDRNSNVIKTTTNDCNVEAPLPVTKPSTLSKPRSKKKTKLRIQSEKTSNETRSTLGERSCESDVYFEIVPKPRNNFGKKRRRP